MRYAICVILGMALAITGIVLVATSVYELARIGTCAVGGPYEIAQRCPDGVGVDMGRIFGGSIAAIAGTIVFGMRSTSGAGGFAAAVWGMFFVGIGTAVWMAGHGDGALSGTRVTDIWLPAMFWIMGGVALLVALIRAFTGPPSATAQAMATGRQMLDAVREAQAHGGVPPAGSPLMRADDQDSGATGTFDSDRGA